MRSFFLSDTHQGQQKSRHIICDSAWRNSNNRLHIRQNLTKAPCLHDRLPGSNNEPLLMLALLNQRSAGEINHSQYGFSNWFRKSREGEKWREGVSSQFHRRDYAWRQRLWRKM